MLPILSRVGTAYVTQYWGRYCQGGKKMGGQINFLHIEREEVRKEIMNNTSRIGAARQTKEDTMSKIDELCKTFGVSKEWALNRRKEYIKGLLRVEEERMKRISGMKCKNDVEQYLLNRMISETQTRINRLRRRLFYIDHPSNGVTPDMIETARSYPIEELLGVERRNGKGNILCPFHDDKRPSASIRNNRLHCFACNKTWGPIDVVMEKEGLEFVEAVKRLVG